MVQVEDQPARIVIIGGGVVGCCIAYYLTRHSKYRESIDTITILEASDIASGSSGKAGGLIASWAEPDCLAPTSFALHSELADTHGGDELWGYRRVLNAECQVMLSSNTRRDQIEEPANRQNEDTLTSKSQSRSVLPPKLNWINREMFHSYFECGDTAKTAQVHPKLFTKNIWRLAAEAGAKTMFVSATNINKTSDNSRVSSVSFLEKGELSERQIQATHVVVAAGPWASTVFPEACIGGEKSHSVVIRSKMLMSNHTLDIQIKNGYGDSPKGIEMYPRPDGTVYVCGFTEDSIPLPATSLEVQPNIARCDAILRVIRDLSEPLAEGSVEIKQACFVPVVKTHGRRQHCIGPIVSKTSSQGLIIAAAHDSWGIQNSPGTGLAVAEMIFDGECNSIDIESLSLDHILRTARARSE